MDLEERLRTERNVWLATVRRDGTPHLTPIWFVWVDERMWVCTTSRAVKTRNVRIDPRVMLSLESGDDPVVGEGTVFVMPPPYPHNVIEAFSDKFQWNVIDPLDPDGPFDALWEITITRWLMGGPSPT
jgi:PPOX class probable F420-dependent enzyme